MAVVTLPSIEKGTPATITLTIAELFTLVGTPFYTDTDNLREIKILYKSTVNSQKALVRFTNLSGPTATGKLLLDVTSDDVFEVQRIVIRDKQNGKLKIERDELNTVEFDINLTPALPVTNFSYDLRNTDAYLDGYNNISTSQSTNIWFKVDSNIPHDLYYFLASTSGGSLGFDGVAYDVASDNIVSFVGTSDEAVRNFANLTNQSLDLDDGDFHLFSITGNNSSITVYIDSIEVATAPVDINSINSGLLGDQNGVLDPSQFNKPLIISDISGYDGIITPSDIVNLYNNRNYVDPQNLTLSANLTHHYTFSDSNPSLVEDQIGSNDLTPRDMFNNNILTIPGSIEKVPGETS